ncbi:inositol monophosphatase family protein [Mesorhizobium sp.]|uniref:inositol monophosphatase family protein n=1 Tax=Mesorhizobium sp. TaxID=1871066 RepID=UPI001221FB62|nr:inositol monophosphatase family protein [Mesorhizobium sp.]TIP14316.1 MAG: inositol monophosphatase [Mesorhizobium sp.]
MIEIVKAIAIEAGEVAMGYFGHPGSLVVESKGHLDLVTRADRDVENLIVSRLRSAFPDDGILGEEGTAAPTRSGRTWVIDPIDGTLNFVRGSEQWSISIGLFDGHRPALGVLNLPAQRKLVVGGNDVAPAVNGTPIPALRPIDPERAAAAIGFGPSGANVDRAGLVSFVMDQAGMVCRNSGCGSLSLLSVALGHVDGYISLGESSWDVMAALAILHALGATSTVDWLATGLEVKVPLICGNPEFIEVASRFRASER